MLDGAKEEVRRGEPLLHTQETSQHGVRYDGGFTPGKDGFPEATIQCYRALVILPLLLMLLAAMSLPFLVLSIAFWDAACWSDNAWWYRPTTLCAVSNAVLIAVVPFMARPMGKAPESDTQAFRMFLGVFVLQLSMKVLEVASIIATPIVNHWCNESLIAIADVLVGSCLLLSSLLMALVYVSEVAESDPKKSFNLKKMLELTAYGFVFGSIMAVTPMISIAFVSSFFALQIAGIVVGVLALADNECGGLAWRNPAVPLIITGVLSLIAMSFVMYFALVNCLLSSNFGQCERGVRNSVILLPFLSAAVAGAVWILMTIDRGKCDSGDRVWWFGVVEAVYCFVVPIVWYSGVAIGKCVEVYRRGRE